MSNIKEPHKQFLEYLEIEKEKRGFTLIELLIVLAIISLIASIIFASLSSAREKAKIAKTLVLVYELQKAINFYVTDTGEFPPSCMPISGPSREPCSAARDPLLTDPGVPGWDGPYYHSWDLAHPWGGQVGFERGLELLSGPQPDADWDRDGIPDFGIFLDDDRPGMGFNDNGGRIPTNILLRIDQMIDDGNLNTGRARGDGITWNPGTRNVAVGELLIKINR